jgi:hypothetical protein
MTYQSRSWLLAACLALSSYGAADQAVVVGINRYPGFEANEQLRGAVSDANAIADKLREEGFEVTVITDSGATEAGIKEAVGQASRKNKANERFVFFFAGHGWRNYSVPGHAALVPHDANKSGLSSPEITGQELAELLNSVPASSRSAMIDSCFSGALPGARSLGNNLVPRTLEHPGSVGKWDQGFGGGSRDLIRVAQTVTAGGTVFYAASGPDQKAYERPTSAGYRGIFSANLEKVMATKPKSWGEAASGINGEVTYVSRSLQSPLLYPPTASAGTFLGSKDTDPKPNPTRDLKSIWDLYSSSAVDPNALEISVQPQKTNFRVGDRLKISVLSRRAGYLVIFNKGASGKYYVQYPEDLSGTPEQIAGAAYQAPDQKVLIPGDGFDFEIDQAGSEHLKAVLVSQKADFLSLATDLKTLTKSSGGREFTPEGARDLKRVPSKEEPGKSFYTADLHITIEDQPESSLFAMMVGYQTQPFRLGLKPATAAQVAQSDKAVFLSGRGDIPSSVLLTRYLPPVSSQGGQGSCVGWAIGYYAYSYALNEGRDLPSDRLGEPQFITSPAFIYNQINKGKDEGSFIFEAAALLKAKGAASLAEMPYNDRDYTSKPDDEAFKKGELDRATEVYLIGNTKSVVAAELRAFLAEMKLPVVFGMPVRNSFMEMPKTPGYVYNGPKPVADPLAGYHALCVVGYDDERKAFRVVNSWGEDWGDKGFFWLSYDHMSAVGFDDWAVIPGGISSRSVSKSRSFKVVRGKSPSR